MKRDSGAQPMRASVLDRLRADADGLSGRHGRQGLNQLIDSVHEHLESLLNTRWRAGALDDTHAELKCSLVNYGIPDFSSLSVASPEGRRKFQEAMRQAIRQHEPRFLNVRVDILDTDDARGVHFRIHGELHAQPEPAHVAFDSRLDPADQRIQVNNSDDV